MPFAHIRDFSALRNSPKEIIYFSRQLADICSHGGCRRTAQIVDALSEIDFGFVSAEDYVSSLTEGNHKKIEMFANYLDGLRKKNITAGLYGKWMGSKRDYLLHLNLVAQQWQDALKLNKQLKLAIVDDPVYFIPLFKYLSSRNIPIVVTCQNIETLSASQMLQEYQRELFDFELDLFSKSDLVVTISREETFLLQNLGIKPFYIPYYPVAKIRDRMLAIRASRKTTQKRDILLIGSVGNIPTLDGMVKFLTDWQGAVRPDGNKARLIVAGFGTEQLQEYITGSEIIFKGALSDSELDQLLAEVKATVVYQECGSGALTKICEFLIAGIPVFANQHAARSYYNIPGIIEFNDINEVVVGLEQVIGVESEIMIPAEPDYSELLSTITNLTKSN